MNDKREWAIFWANLILGAFFAILVSLLADLL